MPQVFAKTYYGVDTAVEGVAVWLHDAGGAEVGAGLTDADGLVFLGDQVAGTYEIRVGSRLASGGGNRLSAVVPADPGPHVYLCPVADLTLPVSTDPALCQCTGLFVRPDGTPAANFVFELTFAGRESLSEGQARRLGDTPERLVVGHVINVATDDAGRLSLPLVRGAAYWVNSDLRVDPMLIYVPDLPSADLAKVMHPRIAGLIWRQGLVELDRSNPTAALNVGDELDLEVAVVLDSGALVDLSPLRFDETNSAATLIDPSAPDGSVFSPIKLTGLAAGVNTISLSTTAPAPGFGFGEVDALLGALQVTVSVP